MARLTLKEKIEKRKRRHNRVRSIVFGTAEKPRIAVFRSNAHIYLQLIDDEAKKTIVASSDLSDDKGKKSDRAFEVGKVLAKKAKEKGITQAVFDRGGYLYHGRVKRAAEGAREAGLKF